MLMTAVPARETASSLPPIIGTGGIPELRSVRASSESALVAGLQRGDDASFEILVREYGGAMLAIARRLLRNEDDAREAVQDAFVQVLRAIPHFREESRLSTWLHRIAVNAALMRLRRTSRRPEVMADDLLPRFDADGGHAEPVQQVPVSTEAVLANAETCAQVRTCISELPEQYRAVIVLRDLEELSTAEAAQILGITENAVKIRLHRARQALRTLLIRALGERPLQP